MPSTLACDEHCLFLVKRKFKTPFMWTFFSFHYATLQFLISKFKISQNLPHSIPINTQFIMKVIKGWSSFPELFHFQHQLVLSHLESQTNNPSPITQLLWIKKDDHSIFLVYLRLPYFMLLNIKLDPKWFSSPETTLMFVYI